MSDSNITLEQLQSRLDQTYEENVRLKAEIEEKNKRLARADENNERLLGIIKDLEADKRLLEYDNDKLREQIPLANKVNSIAKMFKSPKKRS